jgi:hypothetical protein
MTTATARLAIFGGASRISREWLKRTLSLKDFDLDPLIQSNKNRLSVRKSLFCVKSEK